MRSKNIKEHRNWIERVRGDLMMAKKEIDEIGQMARWGKENENGVKSKKTEDGISKIREVAEGGWRNRGISRNVEADR
jgi:hypothetical protein